MFQGQEVYFPSRWIGCDQTIGNNTPFVWGYFKVLCTLAVLLRSFPSSEASLPWGVLLITWINPQETVSDFIFLGSKVTADGDCSHEIKRCLLLGRKVMTNLDSIFKSRDITLPTKVCLVKAMVFPVVIYGCESWTVKKAECRRIDAFELWCWRRLLRVPWTARRSNQSILKEISPGISLEGMMLKLKLQSFGHLMRRVDSLEKTLMLGGIGGRRRRGRQDEMAGWHHWLDGRESEWTPGVGDGQGGLACCDSWGRKESDTTVRLNWTELDISDRTFWFVNHACHLWYYCKLWKYLSITICNLSMNSVGITFPPLNTLMGTF